MGCGARVCVSALLAKNGASAVGGERLSVGMRAWKCRRTWKPPGCDYCAVAVEISGTSKGAGACPPPKHKNVQTGVRVDWNALGEPDWLPTLACRCPLLFCSLASDSTRPGLFCGRRRESSTMLADDTSQSTAVRTLPSQLCHAAVACLPRMTCAGPGSMHF